MKITQTHRGFDYAEFIDRYDKVCSLQKTSLATQDTIWFGISNVEPIIMAVDAERLGLNPTEHNGWVPFDIPKEVQLSSRMHLSQEMLHELMPALTEFLDTGELEGGYDMDWADGYKSFSDDYQMVDFKAMSKNLLESAKRLKISLERNEERTKKLRNELDKVQLASMNLLSFIDNDFKGDDDE